MIKNKIKTRKSNKKRLPKAKAFTVFPSYKKNLSTMKLLTTSSLFQRIVKDVREYLEIPEGGITGGDEFIEKWTDRMDKKSDEMTADKARRLEINRISRKLENKEINEIVAQEQSKLIRRGITWHYLAYTIDLVINKFNLPINFSKCLWEYIVSNKVSAPSVNFDICIDPLPMGMKSISDMPYMNIRIYAKLTNKELRMIKKETEGILGKRLPKYNEIKKIDEEMQLEEWNRNKEKLEIVEQKTYKMTAREIAANVLGNDNTQEVYDNLRVMKNLRKKKFGIE